MDKAVEKLESLSIDELKKILRSQNKSDKRVTDKDLLIQMILCEDDDEDSNVINLPQSYLDLFADEEKKIQSTHKKIKDFFEKKRQEQIKLEIERLERLQNSRSRAHESQSNPPSQRPNTAIFVENVPDHFNEPELSILKGVTLLSDLESYFSTIGTVRRVKVYTDEQGRPKGQVLVIYDTVETMEKAIQYFNNKEICPGSVIKVTIAQFKSEKQQDPTPLPQTKTYKCVLTNLFTPSDLKNSSFVSTMEDLIQSMSQQFGTIVALTHDKNAQVFIQFETHQAASNCAQYWNNRQYNNHTIAAHLEGEKEWQVQSTTTQEPPSTTTSPYTYYNYANPYYTNSSYAQPPTGPTTQGSAAPSNYYNYYNAYYPYNYYYPQGAYGTYPVATNYSYAQGNVNAVPSQSPSTTATVSPINQDQKKEVKLIPIASAEAQPESQVRQQEKEKENAEALESFLHEIDGLDTE